MLCFTAANYSDFQESVLMNDVCLRRFLFCALASSTCTNVYCRMRPGDVVEVILTYKVIKPMSEAVNCAPLFLHDVRKNPLHNLMN